MGEKGTQGEALTWDSSRENGICKQTFLTYLTLHDGLFPTLYRSRPGEMLCSTRPCHMYLGKDVFMFNGMRFFTC